MPSTLARPDPDRSRIEWVIMIWPTPWVRLSRVSSLTRSGIDPPRLSTRHSSSSVRQYSRRGARPASASACSDSDLPVDLRPGRHHHRGQERRIPALDPGGVDVDGRVPVGGAGHPAGEHVAERPGQQRQQRALQRAEQLVVDLVAAAVEDHARTAAARSESTLHTSGRVGVARVQLVEQPQRGAETAASS